MPTQTPLLLAIRDLLFSSKATSAAKSAGVAFRVVRDPAKLAEADGGRLIVDLNQPDALAHAVAWKQRTGGHVTAFVAHVAGDLIAEAKRLGVDRVLSNGGFSANIDAVVGDGSLPS
jgi:hypothetical protein